MTRRFHRSLLRRPGRVRPHGVACCCPARCSPQEVQDQLPEMGTAAESTLSVEDEYRIGRMVMRGLRDSGRMVEDPEINEYLQSLGLRLSSLAHDGNRQFNFFLVNDPTINAFALPGGFIGIHSGLLLETKNESELAAVLAHEVAHVTQRHIARSIENRTRSSLVSTAATLAAILLGAVAGMPRTRPWAPSPRPRASRRSRRSISPARTSTRRTASASG